jgi:ATP-dependent RNA helicase DeaD
MEVPRFQKAEALCRVLDFHRVKLGIVFCNTRIGVDELVEHLQARGYSAEGLHGEHKQAMRDRIMNKFRKRATEILVATDVAARGIDVNDVELVVNYDLPKDEEDYVHRIGRTGRAGKKGIALSFASGRDIFRLRNIERFSKQKIARRPVPTLDQVEAAQHTVMLDKVRETLTSGGLDRYHALVDTLIGDETTASDVAAALLKLALPEAPAREPEIFHPGREAGGFDKRERSREGRESDRGESRFGGARDRGENRFGGDRDREARGREPRGFEPRDGKFDKRAGRKDRNDRPSREFDASLLEGEYATLFLNVGRMQGVGPKDILGALAGESGLPGKAFGAISVQSKHTLAEVPESGVDAVISALKKARIKGVPVKARLAEF